MSEEQKPSKLQYTLYLDGSGDPGWVPPHGTSRSPNYILAGLAVRPDADLLIQEEFRGIIAFLDKNYHEQEISEIHFANLVGRHKKWSPVTKEDAAQVEGKLISLIGKIEPIVFATVVQKKKLKQRYGETAYHPRRLSVQATLHRFNMWLNRNNACGITVMDTEIYRQDKSLQDFVHHLKEVGAIIRGMYYSPTYRDKLEKVINTLLFCPSHMSPGIQVADMVAYIVNRQYRVPTEPRWKVIEPYMQRYPGGSDPSVLPR